LKRMQVMNSTVLPLSKRLMINWPSFVSIR
jgi:hypothetical protein